MPGELLTAGAMFTRLTNAHRALRQLSARELRERRAVSYLQMSVLWWVDNAPGHRIRMQDLAENLAISRSALTHLINRMAAGGLVRRESSDVDRRGAFAVLTDQGKQELREALPIALEVFDRFFRQRLTPEEFDDLARLLDRLLAGVPVGVMLDEAGRARPSAYLKGEA